MNNGPILLPGGHTQATLSQSPGIQKHGHISEDPTRLDLAHFNGSDRCRRAITNRIIIWHRELWFSQNLWLVQDVPNADY